MRKIFPFQFPVFRFAATLALFTVFILKAGAQLAPSYIDWVKPGQIYMEMKVGQNGVYRIPVPMLSGVFGNVQALNPAGFQLFRRGVEQAIRVQAGSDNVLNGGDFIEFTGFINDASVEDEMYQKPMPIRNEYRSIHDDTAHYFLTYTPELNGKRVQDNGINNNSSVPFEPYHWRRSLSIFRNQYARGRGLRGNVTNSSYVTAGEGWTGAAYSLGFGDVVGNYNQFLYSPVKNISNLYLGGPQPELELLQIGRQPVNHKVDVIVSSSLISLDTFRFTGLNSYLFRKKFDPLLIEAGTLHIWPAPRETANLAVAYAMVRYPATFQLPPGDGPLEFELEPNQSNYSRLRFDNVQFQPELYDVSNRLNPIRIGISLINGNYIAGVDNTAQKRSLLIQEEPFVVTAAIGRKVEFRNFNSSNFNYIIVSHKNLRIPYNGKDQVLEYANFRSGPEGGQYQVLLLDMDEVYQRFGYGDRNPLALRNLGGYFVQNNVELKGMFLIGKGLMVNNRFNSLYPKYNYIPTFGVPASDNAFAVGLGEAGGTIAFPVGRLAAYEPEQVYHYLNKVRETEAFQYDDLWKKNVFHISGGLNKMEQAAFTSIVNSELQPKVEGKYMGAKVGSFNKKSNQSVEYVDIRSVVNSGISLLTMFGHSSRSSPDVEIGNASDPTQGYANAGRYPVVIVNGCYTGNVFEFSGSINEDWIFTPNKGAVVFWAATDEGLSAILRRHILDFYSTAFQDSLLFGASIGKIQKETMRRFLQTLSNEPQLDSAFVHQFAIHGDPLIRIFGAAKPDYKTSNAEFYIASSNPTAVSSKIRLAAAVSNFGRVTEDSLKIRINRRLADGTVLDYIYQVKPVWQLDTLYFDIPQDQALAYPGLNRFEISLDFLNEQAEMNELNNNAFFEYFIPASGILPLFPKEYSIVPGRNVKLTVQATDFLAPGRRYIFQIDTSARFNSPVFAQSPEIFAGNVCTWNYLLPFDKDSTVFFWRVRFAEQRDPSDTTWFHMSFEYIKNSESGWSQSNFFQFRKSYDFGLTKNYVLRRWEFPSQSIDLFANISGGSKQGPQQYSVVINGISLLTGAIGTSNCYNPGYPRIGAITLDKCSLKPKFWNYFYDPIGYYYTGCGRLPFGVNIFDMQLNLPTYRVYFETYVSSIVEEGDYLLLFPIDSVNMDTVRKYAVPVLGKIGVDVSQFSDLQNGNPFIIFGQKSATAQPGQAVFVKPQNNGTPANRQVLQFFRNVTSSCGSGMVYSTKVGPASAWKKIHRKFSLPEIPGTEDAFLQVRGIGLDGKDTLLYNRVDQLPLDISAIDANKYPYLQLSAVILDTTSFTPATILRWMVTYDPVPEGILNTSLVPVSEYKVPEKEEGDSLGFRFAFTNISNRQFRDSLNLRFSMNGQLVRESLLARLEPDSTVYFNFPRFSTLGKEGGNNLLAFVNQRIQPEEYYENNALNVPFRIKADRMQPVLDVTFDQVKIMNGDFVKSEPEIEIRLKDENRFLLKSDAKGMQLILTKPCQGCQPEAIPLDSANSRIKIFPAGQDNLFRILYRPEKLADGQYRLAVQGADVKGNAAGSMLYQVEFNVLEKNTISNFFPYPNPFSTSCQWVFTLTGEEPDDFKIQIMTVTGRVVREIFKSELGPIRVGNNITSYRWDGSDSFGDRLANGVYLYRVVMKEGQSYEQRETAGDFTFRKGFGKLYIIR
jgi:hypothetical protein